MRVLSDIHANLPALEAVAAETDLADAFFCGDLIGYYLWPDAVVDVARTNGFRGVRGNHDEALITDSTFGFNSLAGAALRWTADHLSPDSRNYLSALPYTRKETVDGTDILVAHGSPRAPTTEYVHPGQVDAAFLDRQGVDTDVLLLGHTHVPFAKTVGDTLVVNPGSVGQPRDGDPDASYAELDLDAMDATIHRVPYPVAETREAVRDAGLPDRLATRLAEGS